MTLERLNPKGLHPTPGYHHVTISTAQRYAFISGQCPVDEDGVVVGTDDLVAQCNQVAHNVAVALEDLSPGELLEVGALSIAVREPIQAGHKVSLTEIPAGKTVMKYGEVIGIATATIPVGSHTHVHNVASARSLTR